MKFTIDRSRVEAFAAQREAAFGLARKTQDDVNDILREVAVIEASHERNAKLYGGRWTKPPSEISRLIELRAELPKTRARIVAAKSNLDAIGGLTARIAEYANPKPVTFGGSMIKGLTNGQ